MAWARRRSEVGRRGIHGILRGREGSGLLEGLLVVRSRAVEIDCSVPGTQCMVARLSGTGISVSAAAARESELL